MTTQDKNREFVDLGTPELRLKKETLLKGTGREDKYSDSLLGILWQHKKINGRMFEAGKYIQNLHYHYSMHFSSEGWPSSSRSAYTPGETGAPKYKWTFEESENEQAVYKAWQESLFFLRSLGSEAYRSVMKVTLYSTPYDFPGPKELAQCRYGLFCFGNWLYSGKRAKLVEEE